jgi:uncharacterized protein with FMN-binding domain
VRRIIISTAATVSGVVMLLSLKPHTETTAASSAPVSTGVSSGSTPSAGDAGSDTTSGTSSSPSPSPSGSSSGTARSVTGATQQTRWGPVQVKITVKSGKITGVSVVQYPNGNPRDQEINSYALPILNQEAISAQSARIDSVSGATFTSEGYIGSLQSAIDQAGL